MGFTYLVFIRPILRLRRRVRVAHDELVKTRLPIIQKQMLELQQVLQDEGLSAKRREAATQKFYDLGTEQWNIKQMTVWPVDGKTQQLYFSVNTAGAIGPPVLEVLLEALARNKIGVGLDLGNLFNVLFW